MNNSEVEVQFAIKSVIERSKYGNLSRPSNVCVCFFVSVCSTDILLIQSGWVKVTRAFLCCLSLHLILIPVVQLKSE